VKVEKWCKAAFKDYALQKEAASMGWGRLLLPLRA
jgi:hypothetical protein